MNKGDLVDAVAVEMGTTKAEASKAVEAVFACLGRGLAEHERVTIAGFGTFQARTRPARNGINPVTREPMQIAETKTCIFRAAPALRETL